MPATLRSVTSVTNTVAVEIDGDPKGISVSYSTRRLTPRVQMAIAKAMADGADDLDSTIDQFLAIVTSWDFAADVGEKPIPLTKDALLDVPIEILSDVLEAVTDDMSPKEATETSSNTP